MQDLSGSSQDKSLPGAGRLSGQLHSGRSVSGIRDRGDGGGSIQSGNYEKVLEVAVAEETSGKAESLGRIHAGDVGNGSSGFDSSHGCGCFSSKVEGPSRSNDLQPDVNADGSKDGLGRGGQAHPRGGCHDCKEEGEGISNSDTPQGTSSVDWDFSPISESQSCMVPGSVPQHSSSSSISNEDVLMEEIPMAAACEKGSRRNPGTRTSSVEKEPSVAGLVVEQGGVSAVRPLRSNETEVEQPGHPTFDVKDVKVNSLPRGTCQRLKQGVREALSIAKQVRDTSQLEGSFVVLEIFAGSALLSRLAHSTHMPDWKAMPPVDLVFGWDLRRVDHQQQVLQLIDEVKPDLVTLSMPCGPWCSWMNLHDPDQVMEKRAEDLPLWRFARKVWDKQVEGKRLVLSENPLASEGLKLTFMEARPEKHRAKVAQCMFGLKDVESGKPHQKWTWCNLEIDDFEDSEGAEFDWFG